MFYVLATKKGKLRKREKGGKVFSLFLVFKKSVFCVWKKVFFLLLLVFSRLLFGDEYIIMYSCNNNDALLLKSLMSFFLSTCCSKRPPAPETPCWGWLLPRRRRRRPSWAACARWASPDPWPRRMRWFCGWERILGGRWWAKPCRPRVRPKEERR